jgi:hypothetical protein
MSAAHLTMGRGGAQYWRGDGTGPGAAEFGGTEIRDMNQFSGIGIVSPISGLFPRFPACGIVSPEFPGLT